MKAYHGTSTDKAKKIKKEGLKTSASGSALKWAEMNGWTIHSNNPNRPASVYLTTDISCAETYAGWAAAVDGSEPVVLEVEVPDSVTVLDDEDCIRGIRVEVSLPASCIV